MKIIIIGGGIAASEAASAARKQAPEAEITVYSAENSLPYRRPALSAMVGKEEIPAGFLIKTAEFYAANNIAFHTGCPVTAIDTVSRTVTLSGGGSDSFDKLIIASGANCFRPPVPGIDHSCVVTLRNLDDLAEINRRIAGGGVKNTVILGGGILGLEVAESLLDSGIRSVTILERAPRLLPAQLDGEAAEFFLQKAARPGLQVMTDTAATAITADAVETTDGRILPAQLVLVSAGAVPETALAKAAGLQVDRGIVTGRNMESSVPGIYAAGDAAEVDGRCYGAYMPARDMGQTAGINAAGGNAEFAGGPQPFRAVLCGIKLFSVGDVNGSGQGTADEKGNLCREFFAADGKLSGAILIGDVSGAMKLQNALKG